MTRLQHSQDVPPAPAEGPKPGLITQDSVEQSTLVAQTLLESGGLKAGQTITVEGHRPMTVTVENERVVLVPAAEDDDPAEQAEPAAKPEPTTPPATA